jgi:hypothetical protein
VPRPSHSSRCYHPKNIWWVVQIITLLSMKFSPLPCYLVPLKPKYSPQHHILKHPQLNNNNYYHNHHNHHYLLYVGYLYTHSWDKPCP